MTIDTVIIVCDWIYLCGSSKSIMAGSEDEDLGDLNEDVEDCNDDY